LWEKNSRKVIKSKNALLILDGLYIAGAQRHCLDLMDAFYESGFECTLIVVGSAGGKWADKFLSKSLYVILDVKDNLNWSTIRQITSNLQFDFAVAHLTYPARWALLNLPRQIRTFAHFHSELSEHEFLTNGELLEMENTFDAIFFPAVATLKHYLALLEDNNIKIKEDGKWKVLPNAIPRFITGVKKNKRSQRVLKDCLSIAVISRLDIDKISIPLLTETLLNLVKNKLCFQVRIVGDGDCRDEVIQALSVANLAPFSKMLGFIDEHIEEIYNWADVVFLPSKRESMPYVLLESISYGCPIVLPNIGIAGVMTLPRIVHRFPQNNAEEASRLIIKASAEIMQHDVIDAGVDGEILGYKKWVELVKSMYNLY
jgi:glycosyltransferase involved in cell wall biosynthesis